MFPLCVFGVCAAFGGVSRCLPPERHGLKGWCKSRSQSCAQLSGRWFVPSFPHERRGAVLHGGALTGRSQTMRRNSALRIISSTSTARRPVPSKQKPKVHSPASKPSGQNTARDSRTTSRRISVHCRFYSSRTGPSLSSPTTSTRSRAAEKSSASRALKPSQSG